MKWSSAWALDEVDSGTEPETAGRVTLSAGLDRVVEIDGLFDDDIDRLQRWAAGGTIDTDDQSGHLIDRLIGLGAVVAPVTTPDARSIRRFGIVRSPAVSNLVTQLTDRLELAPSSAAAVRTPTDSGEDEALLIVLRTRDRVDLDHRRDQPILHVDLRHEHTLVVGPVELPGLSACDACYDTRLARRWRVPTLPERPGVLDHETLVAELVAFHATRFVSTGAHLVNATIAHSFRDGTATLDTVLRVPGCAGCGPNRPTVGRVRLPWQPN